VFPAVYFFFSIIGPHVFLLAYFPTPVFFQALVF
jgi:hypothetical protein